MPKTPVVGLFLKNTTLCGKILHFVVNHSVLLYNITFLWYNITFCSPFVVYLWYICGIFCYGSFRDRRGGGAFKAPPPRMVTVWNSPDRIGLTLHKFATTNSNFEKIVYFRHTARKVKNECRGILSCVWPNMYINLQQNQVSRSVKTVHTNIFHDGNDGQTSRVTT